MFKVKKLLFLSLVSVYSCGNSSALELYRRFPPITGDCKIVKVQKNLHSVEFPNGEVCILEVMLHNERLSGFNKCYGLEQKSKFLVALGRDHEIGYGVPINPDWAYCYYDWAASMGSWEALEKLVALKKKYHFPEEVSSKFYVYN